MKKIFVGSLPSSATEQEVTELFSKYGKVRSIKLATDLFSNQCKGFGFIEMEGHEARAAIAALDGSEFNGKNLRVNFENPKNRRR
ncbi:MAG: RNA-binding protein [Methylococcus sp.]|nr:MAG: RNA-binding protein [Methylococcus sp.]